MSQARRPQRRRSRLPAASPRRGRTKWPMWRRRRWTTQLTRRSSKRHGTPRPSVRASGRAESRRAFECGKSRATPSAPAKRSTTFSVRGGRSRARPDLATVWRGSAPRWPVTRMWGTMTWRIAPLRRLRRRKRTSLSVVTQRSQATNHTSRARTPCATSSAWTRRATRARPATVACPSTATTRTTSQPPIVAPSASAKASTCAASWTARSAGAAPRC
mmetsp:Transcript_12282/g.33612  ORF Transcript_12282/g.33612 Transcript_12282/m.33612 type:complete len:217 (+) Transcript_12282:291-941(+)